MRAVLLTGHGDVDRLDYRTDVADPVPLPGEVLVRVRASAVNNTDVATRIDWYRDETAGEGEEAGDHGRTAETLRFPRIQGAGAAGVIEAVGPGVDLSRVGETVVVDSFIRDPSLPPLRQLVALLGNGRDGGFAELVAVPSENAMATTATVTFAELACLPTAYHTAEEMQLRAGVKDGDVVLVTGASGGVGAANVELARMRGATVVAVTDPAKRDAVLELGAHHVLGRGDDLVAATSSLFGARAVDVVLDVTGGPAVPSMLYTLKRGGVYGTAGAIAGPHVEIDLRVIIYSDLRMFGQAVARREAMEYLIRYVEEGRLHPHVSAVHPLSALREAQVQFAAKRYVGKIVIDVDGAETSANPSRTELGAQR
ncbi:zinc-binding dehydrogenase [Cnuibacter physcomitrellae]|uniref:zinc-binding dehydrogenase n=1 Tax=Cnuibacter physcomitrellae TaxID=1619308 RepID=UPI002175CDE1|nr:zinc-binding dehydrogenase [Cnuibacter physcomitrellae]MCS5498295.1 zinc-binding dehydrogenase [Cnuibacter physcomitrellae]